MGELGYFFVSMFLSVVLLLLTKFHKKSQRKECLYKLFSQLRDEISKLIH